MNKRIKNKITKKKNKGRQLTILNQISKSFTIEKETFGNGYFIFYMGQNSVVHFHLKETPQWKYAIWLYDEGFEIFGEHIDLIDKFKPSRTYLSCGSNLEEFLNKVKEISLHPKLYFVDSLTGGDALDAFKEVNYGDDYITYKGYQAIREYNEETQSWNKFRRDETITQEDFVNKEYQEFMDSKAEEERNEQADKVYAFDFFKEVPNLMEEIIALGVIDGNKKGWRSSPRYTLRVVVDNNISQERFNQLFDELDKIVWEKNRSKEKKTYEHGFSLFGCYDSFDDIKVCDYRFFKNSAQNK